MHHLYRRGISAICHCHLQVNAVLLSYFIPLLSRNNHSTKRKTMKLPLLDLMKTNWCRSSTADIFGVCFILLIATSGGNLVYYIICISLLRINQQKRHKTHMMHPLCYWSWQTDGWLIARVLKGLEIHHCLQNIYSEPSKSFVEDNNNNCYPLLASTVETSFIYSPSKAKKAEKAAYSGMVDVRSHFALIWRGIHQIKPWKS